MTADPSEEPGRPKRRRRRRRRPNGGSTPQAGTTPEGAGGTGSSDTPPRTHEPSDDVPPRSRRRRRRRRAPKRDKSGATPSGLAAAPDGAGGDGAAPKGAARNGARSKGGTRRRAGRGGSPSGSNPRRKIPTHKEVSAGGVVYRRDDDGALEILLASRRTRRGDLAWGLAKGGIEAGESNEDAAIREVREETGIVAEIEGSLGETKYIYVWEDVRIRKTVHFFLMRATGGDPDDRDDEMEEIRWFPMERALKRAAYRGEREMLGRAAELLGS